MVCKECQAPELQRVRRHGFKAWLLQWFGLYPWECLMCDKVLFYRARKGHSHANSIERMAR